MSTDPVNQFFYSYAFKQHAARFAHELDAAMGHHTLASADERDRLAVWNTMTAMIGSAARRYAEWEAIDPLALIVGGNFDGTPRWAREVDTYIGIDEALCGQCDIATFARRFYLNADLTEFARLWRQGIVYRADRDTTPWSPTIFDVTQLPSTPSSIPNSPSSSTRCWSTTITSSAQPPCTNKELTRWQ